MDILVGADPEVFYREQGQLVSAYGLIEGDKANPHLVDNGAVQVDGMALEFNIDPAGDVIDWVYNIQTVMAQLEAMVEGELDISPIAEFGHEYIAMQPRKASELGCDPDFNAWTGEENVPPDVKSPFRTGAGHVHVGFCEGRAPDDPGHLGVCETIVQQLDARLGLMSLLLDDCTKRREMYGQAGAYRPKSYGVEYRVLSNFWLKSQSLMEWVFLTVTDAIKDLEEGYAWVEEYPEIREIINTSDVAAATAIITKEGWEIPHV
jgi:hypothetical protein